MEFINNNPKDKVSNEYLEFRYGEYLEDKLNDIRDKRKLTLSNFIKKYGEVRGTEKWESYLLNQKKSSKRSLSYWIDEIGDCELAKKELNRYQKSHRIKFIENKTEEEVKKHDLKNSPWRVEYWMERSYTHNDAVDKISQNKKESSLFCKEYYIKRGHTHENALKLSKKYWAENCTNHNNTTSKESLKLFLDFIKYFNSIEDVCVYYGDMNYTSAKD